MGCCTVIYFIYAIIISIISLVISIIPGIAWFGYLFLYSALGIPNWPPMPWSSKFYSGQLWCPGMTIIAMFNTIISLPVCTLSWSNCIVKEFKNIF